MKLYTELHGSEITIRCARIAGYGRPPEWQAELTHWPAIDSVRFGLWPDSHFENVKRRARQMLARSERDCAID